MKINDIERARTLAASLQTAIRRDTGHDVARGRCLDAIAAGCGVARWDIMPGKLKGQALVFDPDLAGKAITAHGVPLQQAIATAHGIVPRQTRHADAADTRSVLAARLGQAIGVSRMAPKAGALVASAGLAWIIREVVPHTLRALDGAATQPDYRHHVSQEIEDQAHALLVNHTDPRLPGYLALALCAWARQQVDDARIDPHLNRSDEAMFAHAVLHRMKTDDAHGLADACGQMPRAAQEHIIRLVAATLAGIVLDQASQPGGIPAATGTPISIAPLPSEPVPYGTLMRNWGPRWRRLDAPDIVMIGQRVGNPILGRGWLKIVGDGRDADLVAIVSGISMGGEQGDVDDVSWVFGVGPYIGAVTPVGALRYIRDASIPGHLHIEIGELGDAADEQVSKAMGMVAGLQFGDDIQQIIERDGKVTVTINVASESPDDVAQGRAVAAAEFAGAIGGMSSTANARMGPNTVTLLGPSGSALSPLRPLHREDSEAGIAESNDLIAIQTQLGDGWGSISSVHPHGAPTIVVVPNPANMAASRIAEIDAEIAGENRMDALLDAAGKALDGEGGEETVARILQLEKARHVVLRRSPLGHMPEHDGLIAGAQIAGERTSDAVVRLVEKLRSEGPGHERRAHPAHRQATPGNGAMLVHVLAELEEDDEDEGKMDRIARTIETAIGSPVSMRAAGGFEDRVQMTAPGAFVDHAHMAKVFEELMRAERPEFLECTTMGPDGMVTVEIDRNQGRARISTMG